MGPSEGDETANSVPLLGLRPIGEAESVSRAPIEGPRLSWFGSQVPSTLVIVTMRQRKKQSSDRHPGARDGVRTE